MLTLQTHERKNDKVVREHPYVRLNNEKGPPVFLQDGQVYSEKGDQVTKLPPWFSEEIKKVDSGALKRVGFVTSETQSGAASLEPAPKRGFKRTAKGYVRRAKKLAGATPEQPAEGENLDAFED